MARRIFITVAEVSGDKHAAQLIRELLAIDSSLQIEGVGGPEMQAAGAVIHRNTVTKAAMGWRGILRAGEVYRLLRWTRRHFEQTRPDLWIGVDSPSMNFHFARAAHERGIPTLQYVAPQLWAWAIWRMKKLRKWVDMVACILPFEDAFFRGHGVNAVFTGHPLFDELPPRQIKPLAERFPNRPPIIGLLGGSRKSEATANFPLILIAAKQILAAFPDATFLAPTTAGTNPVVEQAIAAEGTDSPLNWRITIMRDAFDEFVPRCDLCLTVSGTATLHVAAFNVPMAVVYHVGRIPWTLVGQFLVPTRTFALVNVLGQRGGLTSGHLVPELVPWNDPGKLADIAIDLLRHPEKLEAQRESLRRLTSPLDHHGASANAARLALGMMRGSSSDASPHVSHPRVDC